jgi:peptide/nickel transport system permease protein
MSAPEHTRVRRVFTGMGWSGLGLVAIAVMLCEFLARVPLGTTHVGPDLAPPSAQFPFGTDVLGRDMFSETLYALTTTVAQAAEAAILAVLAGGLLGFVSAHLPRWAGQVLRWAVGAFAAIPALLLALLIIALTARGQQGLAAGLAAAPLAFVRAFDRAQAATTLGHAEYARATGISASALLNRDLAYEFRDTFLSTVARALAAVAVILSTMSFLGFGAVPPHRDLGLMIAAAKASYIQAWWTAAFPALTLMLLILLARLAAGLDEGERP